MRTRGLVGAVCLVLGVVETSWAQAPAAQFPTEAPPAPVPQPATAPATPPGVASPPAPAAEPTPVEVPPATPPAAVAPAPPVPPAPPAHHAAPSTTLTLDRSALEPPPPPNWAAGASIGIRVSDLAFSGLGSAATTPDYLAALERRLGTSAWLLLNLGVTYTTTDTPTPGSGSEGARTKTNNSTFSAVLGVRQVFARGIVDVSGVGALYGRYRSIESGLALLGSSQQEPGLKDYMVGVQAGLAVERKLIEALALRLQLQLVSFGFNKGTTRVTDQFGDTREADTHGTSLVLHADPSVALYFYF
jgi:hypothetical protein